MEILLSVRVLGYLSFLHALTIGFFALLEVPLPVLGLIAAIGILALLGLAQLRRVLLTRARREHRLSP